MSSKNSRVKIHVGRNQKFTSKNSWSKNSHGIYVCARVCTCVYVCVRVFRCYVDGCKVTKNKRTQQHKKIFAKLFFCHIMI